MSQGNAGRESNLQASEGHPLSICPPPCQEPALLLPSLNYKMEIVVEGPHRCIWRVYAQENGIEMFY